jgi:hypothetical protein
LSLVQVRFGSIGPVTESSVLTHRTLLRKFRKHVSNFCILILLSLPMAISPSAHVLQDGNSLKMACTVTFWASKDEISYEPVLTGGSAPLMGKSGFVLLPNLVPYLRSRSLSRGFRNKILYTYNLLSIHPIHLSFMHNQYLTVLLLMFAPACFVPLRPTHRQMVMKAILV